MGNSTSFDSISQFVIVLLIFIGVLAVTFFVTRWMSGYQNGRRNGTNIQLIDSAPLATNKYIQLVRIGKKYIAVAVSKDSVTMLTELDESEIVLPDSPSGGTSFKDILTKIKSGDISDNEISGKE